MIKKSEVLTSETNLVVTVVSQGDHEVQVVLCLRLCPGLLCRSRLVQAVLQVGDLLGLEELKVDCVLEDVTF